MKPWIGVDLDGTLAYYDGWRGPEHIGDPIPLMVARVREWLHTGHEVRIFTARACIPEQIPPIIEWCKAHLGQELPITNAKDFGMVALWDDRCNPIQTNTGMDILRNIGRMEAHFKNAAAREDELRDLLAAMTHAYEDACLAGNDCVPASPEYLRAKIALGEAPLGPPPDIGATLARPPLDMAEVVALDKQAPPDGLSPLSRALEAAANQAGQHVGRLPFSWLSDPIQPKEE